MVDYVSDRPQHSQLFDDEAILWLSRAELPFSFAHASAGDGFLMLQRLTLPLGEAFSPSVIRHSLPSVHQQVLLWLFQDLVLWLIHTHQIQFFRPREKLPK
ncbi:MAG TPA: hypothetical protein VGL94_11060 [Ktedonobacteraceae bacterium]